MQRRTHLVRPVTSHYGEWFTQTKSSVAAVNETTITNTSMNTVGTKDHSSTKTIESTHKSYTNTNHAQYDNILPDELPTTLDEAIRIITQLRRENFALREELTHIHSAISTTDGADGESDNHNGLGSHVQTTTHEQGDASGIASDWIPPTSHTMRILRTHSLVSVQAKVGAVATLGHQRPVWKCAVSLAWLQTFSRDVDPIWTTADVVQKIIIPSTLTTKRRYTDKLAAHEYSSPTFFVSHRWSDRFRELVETLSSHCQTSGLGDPAQTFLWIDIFAVNQHVGVAQAQDLSNLATAIENSTKGTLLVMDPEGGVLKRIWCLYEIHQTVRKRDRKEADVTMLMPKNVDAAVMKDVWTALDVERAEATVMADKDRILAEIRASEVDTQEMNHKLKSTLVKGAGLQVDSARDTLLSTLLRSAQLLKLSGQSQQARPLLQEAIALHATLPNHDSPAQQLKLAAVQQELSDVLCEYFRLYSEALPYATASLATRRKFLPPDHADIALGLDNIGWVLKNLRRYSEAEEYIQEGLTILRKAHPGDHMLLARALGNFSTLLQRRGRLSEATEKQDEALSMLSRLGQQSHPIYAATLGNKSRAMLALKRYPEAQEFALEALSIRERIQGSSHPDLAYPHFQLSEAYFHLGQYDLSITHHTRFISLRTISLGGDSLKLAWEEWQFSFVLEKCGRAQDMKLAIESVEAAERIYLKNGDQGKVNDCRKRRERLLRTVNKQSSVV